MALATALPSHGLQPDRLALPSGFMLAEYRIIEVLGQGGFGITYLCEDTRMNLQVAIKELLPLEFVTRSNDATVVLVTRSAKAGFDWARQRFVEEAQILVRFNHPNVVRAFRLLELNDTAYLVMELVRGLSLRDWIRANPKPTEPQLINILLPLLDGLEYIHQQGLLHRDVSPDNIMIRDTGSPLLLDFGSARAALNANRNFTNVVRHGFSPIEQYQSIAPQGTYTDIYALAGTIIYTLTGEMPPRSVDRCGDHDVWKPLTRRFRHRYSRCLLEAMESAFAVKPQARPQTVACLRRLLAGQSKRFRNLLRVGNGKSIRIPVLSFAAGAVVATILSSLLAHPDPVSPSQLRDLTHASSAASLAKLER